MVKQPTAEELQAECNLFWDLVDVMPETRQKQVRAMMDEIGTAYMSAPASSREEFHSCYPGGLLIHSLNVTKLLTKLAKHMRPGRYQDGTLAFVGLFHDLGKASDGVSDVYVPNPSQWHREKLGALYEVNKDIQHMTIADRSLFLLQRFGVQASIEEFLAIRLADAQNVRENEAYRYKEPDLAILLQTANAFAERNEKASV